MRGIVHIFSSNQAFAALKAAGSVVTWGSSTSGGNSFGVSLQLANDVQLQSSVQSICSSYAAFAALKIDGSVVSWGDPRYGADSSSVQQHLASDVQHIVSSDRAFAAL